MFKKLVPFILIAFVSACSNMQTTSKDTGMKMPCCEKCECCKEGKCNMCMAKHNDAVSKQGDEDCPMCLKAKQEMMNRHQEMKH